MTTKKKQLETPSASVAPAPSIEPLNDGKLWIPVSDIIVTGDNPRLEFKEDEMQDLIASIKSMGILEPLVLKPKSDVGTYDLIAGERRLRAAIANGWASVPCVLQSIEGHRTKLAMLVENVLRADLTPLEEAQAIEDVMAADPELTQADIVRETGKSQAWVSERRQLATLPDDIKAYVAKEQLTLKNALILSKYTAFPAAKDAIESVLEETVESGRSLTPDAMRTLIANELRDTADLPYSRSYLTDVGQSPVSLRSQYISVGELASHFDRAGCDKCDSAVPVPPDFQKAICLDPVCFLRQVAKAEEKLRQHRIAELVAKGIDPEKADKNQLLIDGTYNFKTLYGGLKETFGCAGCANLQEEDGCPPKCLDEACFERKEKEERSREQAAKKQGWAKALDELNALTLHGETPLSAPLKRVILKFMAGNYQWQDAAKVCLKVYNGTPSDADLDNALVRLILLGEVRTGSYPKPGEIQTALDRIHGKNASPRDSGVKVAEAEDDEEEDDDPVGFFCPASEESFTLDTPEEINGHCADCPSRKCGACHLSEAAEVEGLELMPYYCESKNLVSVAEDEDAAEILLCTGCSSEEMCACKPYVIAWGEYDPREATPVARCADDAEEAEN